MLNKKTFIQRSVRFDANLLKDLGTLSELLNRSQSELIQLAIENLINQNKNWMAQNIIWETIEPYVEEVQPATIEIDNLKIELDYDKRDVVVKKWIKSRNESDPYIEKFDLVNGLEELKNTMRSWILDIDLESTDVKEYLDKRFNYK